MRTRALTRSVDLVMPLAQSVTLGRGNNQIRRSEMKLASLFLAAVAVMGFMGNSASACHLFGHRQSAVQYYYPSQCQQRVVYAPAPRYYAAPQRYYAAPQ